ncbi:peptide-methionine (S)-S-oxide reductase MsrA [Spiroplasma cantharicola]|uniref:Peptide methionine sulfoxide reductase MsrA n=1 Tax=Spiroplasma cantharicola TaxID=362837 RepID=A0A0M4JSE2_9MOLU|nr:peptide-methionine (S)-S-oxide reductase MsrA [Spiroplasma cantharicola]ALD66460.1 peptide methionine sulfoxide reductase MsrA/MsrB [Spiroplasma cantharicola]
MKSIYLAGGCFWGVQAYFDLIDGVTNTKVGYCQGDVENPTYEQVCSGKTNHAEAIWLEYNDKLISLEKILEKYFKIINPYSLNKQGNDIGTQYRVGIYWEEEEDFKIVQNFLEKKQKDSSQKIVVENQKVKNFFDAEEYHQSYLEKNPFGYCHIDLSLAYQED